MFSHVMVGANNLEASRQFYDAVLGALGIGPGVINRDIRYFYRTPSGVFPLPCRLTINLRRRPMAEPLGLLPNRSSR